MRFCRQAKQIVEQSFVGTKGGREGGREEGRGGELSILMYLSIRLIRARAVVHIHALATGDMRPLLTQHPQIRTARVKHDSVRPRWRSYVNFAHKLRLLDILQGDMPTGQDWGGGGREGSEGAEAGGDGGSLFGDVRDNVEEGTGHGDA
jgi:hypothetical protein